MSQTTHDSTMSSLRELMQLEEQRVRAEHEARVRAESERVARIAAAAAAAAAETARRAAEAEAVRTESERAARAEAERFEADRRADELRAQLEIESRERAEVLARLQTEREERLALAARPTGARVSGSMAALVVGLVCAAVGVAGFVARQQTQTRLEIARMQAESAARALAARPTPVSPPSRAPSVAPRELAPTPLPGPVVAASVPISPSPIVVIRHHTAGHGQDRTSPANAPSTRSAIGHDLDNLDRATALPGSETR